MLHDCRPVALLVTLVIQPKKDWNSSSVNATSTDRNSSDKGRAYRSGGQGEGRGREKR